MRRILINLLGTDGNMTQIGDNDSGRVLKINPYYKDLIENTLRVDDVLDFLNGLFGDYCKGMSISDIYSISAFNIHQRDIDSLIMDKDFSRELKLDRLHEYPFHQQHCIAAPIGLDFSNFKIVHERGFAFLLLRWDGADLFIRTIPEYKRMLLAHAHDDIFHYELCTLHGRHHPDCGSVSYMSSKKYRQFFSENTGHNVPIHREFLLKRTGRFTACVPARVKGYVIVEQNIIYVCVETQSYKHIRAFSINKDCVVIDDYSDECFVLNCIPDGLESFGYGQLFGDIGATK
jgi:hypothetical protein